MINLQHISQSTSNNLVYNEFYPNQKFGFSFLTYYPAKCGRISEINAVIIENILKFNFYELDEDILITELTEFFVQLNWRLYSIFRKVDCEENGISIVFVLNKDDNLLIIPFGRFICGLWDENGMKELGLSWEHFTVKSMQEFMFLGNLAQDITPNIVRHKLDNRSGLTILPANRNNYGKFETWHQMLNALQNEEEEFPHFIIKNGIIPSKIKKRFGRNKK